ncbi:pilus assembly protein FimV [Psychrobacter sp. NZS113]|uniref:FimV/HubP family polar landmark protein n=1 Tax=Psychrobacter sp. NZS113 TaxID=2792045 RepID=UPI0018CF69DE|nr:FimV/HubP family polar landmark protein [Psychrobacter sp. NZS113]MBH0096106.1 pilus assembly protein FimV [Psychrobacter sp. NZS113]
MDNMLYIIAGLVLILLVVGLVLRKNKAQKSSLQPLTKSEKSTATSTPAPIDKAEDKFNPIIIAQRFMDQQRYDKAIETLNRDLRENPSDGDLSLKLLSIYATINQPENFNKVYDSIKTQGDSKSIALADDLKGLFSEEQNQVAAKEAPVEDNSNFESIDFDLPTDQSDSNNDTLSSESIVSSSLLDDSPEATATNNNVEDSFDLTLNDLESSFSEPAATSTAPVASDMTEDAPTTDTTTEDSELIDFDFSFDSPEETSTSTEPSIASAISDNITEDKPLDNEAFVLDFDDLSSDVNQNTEKTLVEELVVDSFEQDTEEDFALSLDNIDTPNDIEASLENEKAVFEDNSDNFVLQDSSFGEPNPEESLFEETVFEETVLEEDAVFDEPKSESSDSEAEDLEKTNVEENLFDDTNLQDIFINGLDATPTDISLFDDNSIINDEFAVEPLTAATPVDIETDIAADKVVESPGTAEEFSSRFAADFDFVKSLDSNQVTLDLAGQYLQLGEYDSAKRLLNEVIAHGDSEQQSQAQILLERTA